MDSRVIKPKNDESGTLGATLSVAETTSITLTPVPENAPGVIVMRPGTAYEEHIFYRKRDAGAGTVSGLVRDYTNLNGGVGREHLTGAAWETMQSAEYIKNLVDLIQEGWAMEPQVVAKVDGDTFTVQTNQTSVYTAGKFVRYNQDNAKIGVVISSSYSAGTGLTTVETKGFTVPTLTDVEVAAFQPKGFSGAMPMFYGEDAGASDTYAITVIPTIGAYFIGMTVLFKANTANTGAATLNVNTLGAITIKKLHDQDLADGDIEAGQYVLLVYDGTYFQMQTPSSAPATGGTAFWTDVPGTPTRVSDTQFTITDTGNANLYDKLFQKGTLIKWTNSGIKKAMVISSSYATNAVTINIVGDAFAAGFSAVKYCIQQAIEKEFVVVGGLSVGVDFARTWYIPFAGYILSVDAYLKTAYTTNPCTFDMNDDGTTIITTKPSVAAASTSDIDNVSDMGLIAKDSAITVDVDAIGTAPSGDGSAYLKAWVLPESWLYRS